MLVSAEENVLLPTV